MKRDQKSVLDRASATAAIIGALLTLIVAVLSFIPNLLKTFTPPPSPSATYAAQVTYTPYPTETPVPTITPTKTTQVTPSTPSTSATPNTEAIQTEIAQLRLDIKNVQQKVDSLNQNQNSSEIAKINSQVASIDTRLSTLEQVVLDNPAKALSIILLNKDIESIQQRQDSDMQALRDEISRVYGLNQWFLGIMIPMAISVVGLSIRNFLGDREGKKDKTEDNKPSSASSDNSEKKSG